MKVYVVHIFWFWDNKYETQAFKTLEKVEQFLRDVLTNHKFSGNKKSVLMDNKEVLTVDTVVRIILHHKWYENDWKTENDVYPFNVRLLEREVL